MKWHMRRPTAALILIASLLSMPFTGPVFADVFKDAADAIGRGDDKTAFRLLKPLAEQGNAKAQYNLGVFYQQGWVVPKDHAEAVKWYRKAADQGEVLAQWSLGGMYQSGLGVTRDYVLSHMWYSLAAPRLSEEGRNTTIKSRDFVASKMTPAKIAEAQKLAREWKPKKEK